MQVTFLITLFLPLVFNTENGCHIIFRCIACYVFLKKLQIMIIIVHHFKAMNTWCDVQVWLCVFSLPLKIENVLAFCCGLLMNIYSYHKTRIASKTICWSRGL